MTLSNPTRFRSLPLAVPTILGLLLAVGANGQSRTIEVSPIPGDPASSGQALVEAIESLDVTPDRPALVRLDPGTYHVEETSVVLRPGLTVEGAGAGMTTIQGYAQDGNDLDRSKGVVQGSGEVALRNLTVQCRPHPKYSPNACLSIAFEDAFALVENVEVDATGPGIHWGFRSQGSSVTIQETSITLSGGLENYGVVSADGTRTTLEQVTVIASGGSLFNAGVYTRGASWVDRLDDSELWIDGGDHAYGIYQSFTSLLSEPTAISDSTVIARDAATAIAVGGDALAMQARGTTLEGESSAIEIWTDSWIDLLDTDLAGSDYAVVAAEVRLGTSRIRDGGGVLGLVEATCIGTAIQGPTPQFLPETCPEVPRTRGSHRARPVSTHPGSELGR